MKTGQILFFNTPTDWSQVPVLDISERVRPLPTEAKATGQICRSEDALLIRIVAEEVPVPPQEQGLLAMPCRDSCLEFFLRPVERELRYINFEWNANGSLYLGIGSGPADLIRIVPREDQKQRLFSPVIQQSATGWEIVFKIPYTFILEFFPDFEITPGTVMYGNFYKCGDLLPEPHYLAWNPILREGKYLFHTPQEFGKLCVM